jgi:hypothetical protein
MEQHQRSGVYEPVSWTDVCPNIARQISHSEYRVRFGLFPEWFLPMSLHIFLGLDSLTETIGGSRLPNIHLHTSINLYVTGCHYYCKSVFLFSGTQTVSRTTHTGSKCGFPIRVSSYTFSSLYLY